MNISFEQNGPEDRCQIAKTSDASLFAAANILNIAKHQLETLLLTTIIAITENKENSATV